MRRIQLHLDEATDDRLAAEARRVGISKAALIRQRIDQASADHERDPIDALIGASGALPADNIDAIVYDR
jgi:hypothetical protein